MLKKLHSLHDQVIKIQRIVSPEDRLIFLIHTGNLPCIRIAARIQLHLFRCDQFILGMGNLSKNASFLVDLGIDIKLPEDFLHDCFLVVGIIDGKITAKAQHLNMSAQDPHAGGMEGGDPYALRTHSRNFIHTFPHLTGGLVSKGDRQDIPWVYTLFFH